MIEKIGEFLLSGVLIALGLFLGALVIGLSISFVVGFFAIPVWIVCWAFDLAFSWKVVIGIIAIFVFLAMISG